MTAPRSRAASHGMTTGERSGNELPTCRLRLTRHDGPKAAGYCSGPAGRRSPNNGVTTPIWDRLFGTHEIPVLCPCRHAWHRRG